MHPGWALMDHSLVGPVVSELEQEAHGSGVGVGEEGSGGNAMAGKTGSESLASDTVAAGWGR